MPDTKVITYTFLSKSTCGSQIQDLPDPRSIFLPLDQTLRIINMIHLITLILSLIYYSKYLLNVKIYFNISRIFDGSIQFLTKIKPKLAYDIFILWIN
jgi:hypothetical protein